MTDGHVAVDRRGLLLGFGASESAAEELLAHAAGGEKWSVPPDPPPSLPLADEPQLETWRAYAEEAGDRGVLAALRDRLVQLRFPIREGISKEEGYRAATLRGVAPRAGEPGLDLEDPEGLRLELASTIAGTVPVLSCRARPDFERLVQALTARNEPWPVPASMGACLVNGLNNWDRIRAYRAGWEAGNPARRSPGAWKDEFRRLVPRKELYQDRLVILSRGPYSGVAGADAGMGEAEWLDRSYAIRREHECTHFLALRVFGGLRHDLLEELVADFAALVRVFGEYREELALRFLGLEDRGEVRPGGRLEVYRGTPPLSDGAFRLLGRMAVSGVDNLARLAAARSREISSLAGLGRLVVTLSTMVSEELVAEGFLERVAGRHQALWDSPGEGS